MSKLKVCCVSDTHGKHEELDLSKYPADVLVHAGDFTRGKDLGMVETLHFIEWFAEQPYKHKLFIAGNHERQVEAGEEQFKYLLSKFPEVTYIHQQEITIDGIKFYGSNYSNEFCDWAFMGVEMALSKIWAKIPNDTQVLVTHGPSYGSCDLVKEAYGRDPHVGSQSLTNRKKILDNLQWHISGHIHEAYGIVGNNLCASIVDEEYRLVNKPIIIEVEQ